MKTTKDMGILTFESVLGQLRHAYALMVNDGGPWEPVQRKRFAEGLVGPQIARLERLALDYAHLQDDLVATFAANAKQRRQLREVKSELLAHAGEIGSASQARRIITSVFHHMESE